jgi:hypothetical protein
MFGRFVPARLWEAAPVRALRLPVARLIGRAHGQWRHRRKHQRMRAGWRAHFSEVEPYLAPGTWRVLKFRKRKPGSLTEFLLIHESSDPRSVLRDVVRRDVDRYRIWSRPFRRLRSVPERNPDENQIVATAVWPRDSEALLGFDFDRRLVIRMALAGFTPEYEQSRGAFSARVPSVTYEVLPGRLAIVEPLLEGPLFCSVPVETQVAVTLELLELLAELAAHAHLCDSRQLLAEAIQRTQSDDPVRKCADSIIGWLGRAPCVPTHGDLHPANIIFSTEGPICIDFGSTGWWPAWFDGVRLSFAVLSRAVDVADRGHIEALTAGLERFLILVTEPGPEGLPSDWRRLMIHMARALYGPSIVNPRLSEGPNAWAAVR